MSFIDDIVGVGGSIWDWAMGPSLGANLARTAILGFALNQINKSINADNQNSGKTETKLRGMTVREKLIPDTENKIPVLYGSNFVRGIITDARMVNQKTMWYCLTLCEVTGNLLSTGAASQISFHEYYWDGAKVAFQGDGKTISTITDSQGVVSDKLNGNVKIWSYKNGSAQPFGGGAPAYSVMPGWTANHAMSQLAFLIIKVDYNKIKDITGLGEIEVKIKNTMTQPGDVLYDYMTNKRYGAGIAPGDIYGV